MPRVGHVAWAHRQKRIYDADMTAGRERLSDLDYLKAVKGFANAVVETALDEGWLSYLPDPDGATPLQRAVNELARNLRHVHYDGDGCLDVE